MERENILAFALMLEGFIGLFFLWEYYRLKVTIRKKNRDINTLVEYSVKTGRTIINESFNSIFLKISFLFSDPLYKSNVVWELNIITTPLPQTDYKGFSYFELTVYRIGSNNERRETILTRTFSIWTESVAQDVHKTVKEYLYNSNLVAIPKKTPVRATKKKRAKK